MAVVTYTRFTIDPANAPELRAKHADLVSWVRSAVSGLAGAQLGRVDDRTWVGIWRWESPEHLQAARQAVQGQAAATATFALAEQTTAEQWELVDEL